MLMMHDCAIEDFAEMLKEEFSEIKLFLKLQSVQHHETLTTGWFVKLHPDIHVETCYKLFHDKVKLKVVKPQFALVVKYVFNGEKQKPRSSYSFISKNNQPPKAVHVEVCTSKSLEVTSAIREIIKIEEFSRL